MEYRSICRFGKQCNHRSCKALHLKDRIKDARPPKNHERRSQRAAKKQKVVAKKRSPPRKAHRVPFCSPLIEHPDFVYEVITFVSPHSLSSSALAVLTAELLDMTALRIIADNQCFYKCLLTEANMPLCDVLVLSEAFHEKKIE
jgi:hypothetical protein